MFANFIGNEIKKWFRDPLMRFMVFYPIVFGLIGRYLLPWLANTNGFAIEPIADVFLVVLTLLIPQVYGALTGFSILEDRDDKILTSIKVTPLSIHQFLSVRLVSMVGLSFVACIYVLWFTNIGGLTWGQMVTVSALASLLAPFTGLLINSLSNNKIEGFAVMKGVGVLLILPVVSLFFYDMKELLFMIAPGYWPAKAISSIIRGEGVLFFSYYQYLGFGFLYIVVLNFIMYRVFLNKTRT